MLKLYDSNFPIQSRGDMEKLLRTLTELDLKELSSLLERMDFGVENESHVLSVGHLRFI